MNYVAQFVKPAGPIGIAGAGLVEEMPVPVPAHLAAFWTQDLWALHSVEWWRRHWERTGLVEIQTADARSDGWRLWSAWQRQIEPETTAETVTVEADAGRYLTYIRLVGRRRAEMPLAEYAWPDTLRALLQRTEP